MARHLAILRTSYTSSPLTPQKCVWAIEEPSKKKNKKNRHKGEREIYTSWEGKSHSGWDTLKRIIIRLMKPTRIMSGCCCNPSLFLSLFVFFFYFSFLLREEVKKKKKKWVIRKCGRWERRDDWRGRSES
jgi:hypothetical protein